MVTLSPRGADKEHGDWVIWVSHLAPEDGKLETNFHTINYIKRTFLETRHDHHTKLCTFPMMSSLPVSQSSSNHRRGVTDLMCVLWPVWVWLQHRVWPVYEEVFRTVGCSLGTCKSAMARYSRRIAQEINYRPVFLSGQRCSLCLFVRNVIPFRQEGRAWTALSFDSCSV